uniref:Carboxylesterase type B domain-containing protein n=1 Tax=Salmo trutta TaxID=8032 RepID=A0A674BDZ3_SALTR
PGSSLALSWNYKAKLIYLYLCFQCTPIVKFVLIGHRLGLLYFLSLPDSEVVCGDDGMHDQRLALCWVANNIAAFGRDPSKVTQLFFLLLFFYSHSLFYHQLTFMHSCFQWHYVIMSNLLCLVL